jgi:small-conductance mechanosensitive channel
VIAEHLRMDGRTTQAILIGLVWLVVIVVTRWALRRAFGHYEARLSARSTPDEIARRRTTFTLLQRVVVALIITIGVWNVLSIFPQTTELAKAMLASSAVLALFAGLAFSTPLSNLGSGLLVAFSQPLRLGDRVTVQAHTGYVEDVALLYTTLRTDDDRRIFIPNSQLTAGPIVNRTIRDPRRAIAVTLPVRLDAPLDEALAALAAVGRDLPGTQGEPRVLVSDVAGGTTSVTVGVYTPLDADVALIESDLRTRGLRTLADRGLLPGG